MEHPLGQPGIDFPADLDYTHDLAYAIELDLVYTRL